MDCGIRLEPLGTICPVRVSDFDEYAVRVGGCNSVDGEATVISSTPIPTHLQFGEGSTVLIVPPSLLGEHF
jgi:hypothetical protein